MKNQLFYIFCLLLTVLSCDPIPEINVDLDQEPFIENWTTLDMGEYRNIQKPLIAGDNLIIMIEDFEASRGWINCYDKHTLELKWTWQEAMDTYANGAIGFGSISCIVDNVLCISQANLSYGIDVNTGETLWHDRAVNGSSYVNAVGSTLVGGTYEVFNEKESIRVASAYDGQWKNIHTFEKEMNDSLLIGRGTGVPFEWQGKEYVCYVNTKWKAGPHLEISWLNLYNLTEDKLEWTSDTIPLFHSLSGTPGNQPVFEDGQILLSNDAVYSYNIEDGSLEWSKLYGNINRKMLAEDGILYVNNESKFLYALDVHTGEEIFNITSGGSTSNLDYHDGKIYLASLTNNGQNTMIVVDANSGAVLQELMPPNLAPSGISSQWFYNQSIAVDPETGLLYTGDHRYLLVYDLK